MFFLCQKYILGKGSRFVQVLECGQPVPVQMGLTAGWDLQLLRSEMADPEQVGDKQEHLLVSPRHTGGSCAGPARAEPASVLSSKACVYLAMFMLSMVHHGPTPRTHPMAGLGSVGVHRQDGGKDKDVVRPSMTQDGGCSDSNHHEPAQGGCQRWVLTTALQHRGVWEAAHGHGHQIRWLPVAVGALSCQLDSHGQAATGHMQQGQGTGR